MPTRQSKAVGNVDHGTPLTVRPREDGAGYVVLLDGKDISSDVSAVSIEMGHGRLTTAKITLFAKIERIEVGAEVEIDQPTIDVSTMGMEADA